MNYDNIKIKVNGVELPAPIDIDYSLEDLDADSERDVQSGVLDRNRIRPDVFKLSLTYGMNSPEDISKILKTISPGTLSVELYDIKNNNRMIKTMYAGPKSTKMICNENVWLKGLKFNLTEV